MMRTHLRLLLLAGAITPVSPAWAQATLGPQARAILQNHCANCHGGGKAVKGGFGFILDRDQLVSRLLVTPGQAQQSDLFTRVQQGEMPPASVKQRLNATEIKTLKSWIDAGAPAFDPSKAVKILTPAETNEAILKDLEALDPRRHRFTRYLTLSHLAFAGRPTKDLDMTRDAAGKLLNSLSWHPRITVPEAVDADATILRIDLRAYKWTAAMWDRLATANPYRLQTVSDGRAFAKLTGTEHPALRADWFVATASRPPFYHDLLQLPTGDKALERLLQVDIAANLLDDNVQRAGFNDSGVSKNNRLLERHDGAYGAFWRSHDFSANTGRQNLFEHPVGPNTGATSFQPAGGEMIFHLPNGLQGYMLANAKGQRIDKGPIEIVADPRRPDQKVETGISCMSCHARGLLFKADQLRGHVEKNAAVFGKQIVDTVRATHPRKARFQAQIEEDNVRYLKALEKLGGARDPEQEPVNLVTLRFEATLDGKTAASELGLTLSEFGEFLAGNVEQKRIFGSLFVKGGTAQRTVFQEHFPALSRRLLEQQATAAAKANPKRDPGFTGHTATVNCVAFSPDGTKAASGSDDRSIRVWEVPSGRLLAKFESKAEVYAVAFSPNGAYILGAGRDRVLRLWDLRSQKLVHVFEGHTDAVRAVAFSTNGQFAASGSDDRSLRVWEVSNAEERAALAGHGQSISSVVWAKSGRILTGSRDGTLRWWDWNKKQELFRLEGHAGPVLAVALSGDAKWALSGGNDQTVRLWSLPGRSELHAFKGHASGVVAVQFASEREAVSGASQHRTSAPAFRRWDVADRKEIGVLEANGEDSFGCVAFSPDGRTVLVGGPGGFLRLQAFK